MNGNEFDKLLSITEKTIIHQDRVHNQVEKLTDRIERLTNLLEKKIDNDEKFSKWMKTITAIMGTVGALVATWTIIMGVVK